MNGKLLYIAAAFLFAAGATSCNKDNDKNKEPEATLVSIAVTTPPDKLAYWADEAFDPAGMTVTATYSDETTSVVTVTADMLAYDFAAAGAQTVTITFGGKTAQVTGITVTCGIRIVTEAEGDIKLRLTGTGEAVIDWGDGEEEPVTLVNPTDIGNDIWDYEFPHTYASAATKTITVTGYITGMVTGDTGGATALNVSACPMLKHLYFGGEKLTSLDVSRNTALEYLWCRANQLTSMDVSNNTALTRLHCMNNQLTSLDVSNNTAITWMDCSDNQLPSLDVSKCAAMNYLYCANNQLTSLDVSKCAALITLSCGNNQLPSLDVSNNTALTNLFCSLNQLTSLDVTALPLTGALNVQYNYLPDVDGFTGTWDGERFVFEPQRTP